MRRIMDWAAYLWRKRSGARRFRSLSWRSPAKLRRRRTTRSVVFITNFPAMGWLASRHLRKALEMDEDYGEAFYVLGLISERAGQKRLAEKYFEKAGARALVRKTALPKNARQKLVARWLRRCFVHRQQTPADLLREAIGVSPKPCDKTR